MPFESQVANMIFLYVFPICKEFFLYNQIVFIRIRKLTLLPICFLIVSIIGRIQARSMCCFLLSFLLVSFSPEKFVSSSSTFMNLRFLNASYLVECPSILCFTDISSWFFFMLYIFSRNITVVNLVASYQVVVYNSDLFHYQWY